MPFIDHKLVEFCATIPNEFKIKNWTKKYLLRQQAAKYLPQEILAHRKQGFASPMTQWLNNDLQEYVTDILSKKNLQKHGLFNSSRIQTLVDEHKNRIEIHDKLIWALVIFQTWYEAYVA